MKLSTRMNERVGFLLLMVAVAGAIYSLYGTLRSEKMLTIAVRQGVESVALKKVVERFSRESGVTIRIKEFPYEELFNQEQEQVRSHRQQSSDDDPPSAFDVILIDDPWFPALMIDPPQQEGNREGIRDEGFRLKKLKRETYDQKDYGQKDFVGNTLNLTNYCPSETSCDDFYGVPFVGNSQLFCYNASDFSESAVPHNWDELAQKSATEGKRQLGYVTRVGADNSIVTDFLPILWAYDAESFPIMYKKESSPFADRQKAARAFQTMGELVKRQKANGLSVDDFDVAAYLADGRASMGIVWSAWAMSLRRIQAAQPKAARQTLKCGTMPGDAESGGRPELGVWLLAIPKTSAMQDEAEEFIRYATSYEQMLIAAVEGNPPPRRSVLSIPERHGELKRQDDRAATLEKRSVPRDHDHLDSHDPIPCVAKTARLHERECETEVIKMIVEEYGELFASQLHSLDMARPRPRTPCWKILESILGRHLQNLIVAEGQVQLSNIGTEITNANQEAQDSIKFCPTLGPPQNIH